MSKNINNFATQGGNAGGNKAEDFAIAGDKNNRQFAFNGGQAANNGSQTADDGGKTADKGGQIADRGGQAANKGGRNVDF
ncbi:hypothetical protein [Sporosarcina ureilytica]|uniref:Uncharacterized protein n=1 Tax=Sporosarcina ureilytica TaxID=298596 RepID=A0A1D8JDD9_9BACL|nr:hypothetical protein [Sporosarcina ureilytica]AOV06711.1 hypothetical protein BI350_03275 [Sporosarcina ureilytica]